MTRPLIVALAVASQHGVTARSRIALSATVAGSAGSSMSVVPVPVGDTQPPKTFARLRSVDSDCQPPGPTATS